MLHTRLLGLLYAVAVFVPGVAVGVRRLDDAGRSGWWMLIALIPLIGVIVLMITVECLKRQDMSPQADNV